MFTYNLSIFLTSTAFVSTNAKIRHTSFEIYRILAKLSFNMENNVRDDNIPEMLF